MHRFLGVLWDVVWRLVVRLGRRLSVEIGASSESGWRLPGRAVSMAVISASATQKSPISAGLAIEPAKIGRNVVVLAMDFRPPR